MNWIVVVALFGLTFIIGGCVGTILELRRSSTELKEMWRLYQEGEKIHEEIQGAIMMHVEKLEEQNIAQHNIIEMLGGYPEVVE